MSRRTYYLYFESVSSAEANLYAEELRHHLLNASPDIAVQRQREDPHTQDFGNTLVLLLGAPAIVSVATALGNWLQLRNKASLTIETEGKKIIAQNLTSKDVAQLTQLFLREDHEENIPPHDQ